MDQALGPSQGGPASSRTSWPKFVLPPKFSDPNTNRQAGMLNFMLWVGLSIIAVHIVITLAIPATPYLNVYFELLVVALQAACLALLHFRKPRLAAFLYILGLWLVVSIWATALGQVTSTGISTLYTVILVAGVLLGPAGGLGLAALSTVAVMYIAIANPAATGQPDWGPTVIVIVNFVLVAVMAIIGEHALRTSLQSAERSHSLLSQRSAQLQATADIGMAATTSTDVDDFLKVVTQVIAERFNLHHVSILTLTQGTTELSLKSLSQGGLVRAPMPDFPLGSSPGGKSIIAHVARTRKPYLATDVSKDPLYLHHEDLGDTRSEIAVPILEGNRLFGVLDVISNKDTLLGTDDLNALQILCNQLGTAIHNKSLALQARQHLEELRILHSVATAAMAASNEDDFLVQASKVVGPSLHAQNFSILLIDEKRRLLEPRGFHREESTWPPGIVPLGKGITGLVAESGEPLRVGDVLRDPDYLPGDDRVRSELAVPLKSKERVIGVLDVESYRVHAFGERDQQLLEALADQISLALERIRLLADTERRAEELAETLQKQEELARLRDEFVQNVSHEFRTPLAIVSGYIEILSNGDLGPLPESYHEPVEIISRRTQMLTRMVEDLTSLLNLKDQRNDFTTLYLSDVLNAIHPGLRTKALAQQLDLAWEVEPNLPPVHGEETLLRTMVTSLIDNAIKFTAQGQVSLRATHHQEHIHIHIHDTGIGIPPEQQGRVFDRFYQVDGSSSRRFGGTGLGLALVKEIVELHGGEISLQSAPQQGTTFEVRLPVLSRS